jgi:hypothetical protein
MALERPLCRSSISRKKIGKQLLEAAQNHCTATHAKGVSLETEQTNVVGNKLYPIMGFKKILSTIFIIWKILLFQPNDDHAVFSFCPYFLKCFLTFQNIHTFDGIEI